MLNTSELKKIVKEKAGGRRVGKDFIEAFDLEIRKVLDKAVALDLGKRKTLGAEDVPSIFGK